MGSQFLTLEEASTRLKVTVRTVYRHISRGYLRTQRNGNTVLVCEEDLQRLAAKEEDDLPFPINKKTLAGVVARVHILEKQVDTLMRLQNLLHEKLKLTGAELMGYYRMAEHYSTKGWPPHSEEALASFFCRIRYDDLEGMAKAASVEHPWKPLFKLVRTMEQAPFNKDLKDLLVTGKANVEHLSQLWVELHGGSEKRFAAMAKQDSTPLKRLIKHLEKQQDTSPKSPH